MKREKMAKRKPKKERGWNKGGKSQIIPTVVYKDGKFVPREVDLDEIGARR